MFYIHSYSVVAVVRCQIYDSGG